jgi:hypothetical protein
MLNSAQPRCTPTADNPPRCTRHDCALVRRWVDWEGKSLQVLICPKSEKVVA